MKKLRIKDLFEKPNDRKDNEYFFLEVSNQDELQHAVDLEDDISKSELTFTDFRDALDTEISTINFNTQLLPEKGDKFTIFLTYNDDDYILKFEVIDNARFNFSDGYLLSVDLNVEFLGLDY